jgi:hypothetical protein
LQELFPDAQKEADRADQKAVVCCGFAGAILSHNISCHTFGSFAKEANMTGQNQLDM